jgi:uncharacterized protein YndB with AHSA1/START domain
MGRTLHIGIVGCSAEGAALRYRTICTEGERYLGSHAHPEVSMHTVSFADHVACLDRVVPRSPLPWLHIAEVVADALVKWMAPNGFTVKVHHLEARVGGTYRMSFTNFTTGNGHSFGGEYLELLPNERIRHTDRFDDPKLPGAMVVTVTIKAVSCGTELNIVQDRIPEVIPLEAWYMGWQESLVLLAKLVEAEITE